MFHYLIEIQFSRLSISFLLYFEKNSIILSVFLCYYLALTLLHHFCHTENGPTHIKWYEMMQLDNYKDN